ncbi:hypothetical protein [Novosphingobium colocasiae]|uniref:hypothetical protein n=1 Tax=Novosphingobium colocasiae TaxID=1256513 RepID=UPI0035AD89E4
MNLRAIANRSTRRINGNLPAILQRSTGYTTDDDGRQVPAYADDEPISIQMQALTQKEVEHLDRLNISDGQASVFANTQLSSVDRPSQTGGDLLIFGTDAAIPESLRGTTWLVVAILEGWPGSGWCKAAVTSQVP